MVVLSQPISENLAEFETCMSNSDIFTEIPIIDLSDTNCKKLIVEACKELGFFKVINHGVSIEFLNRFEAEAVSFFKLPQEEKDKMGPPKPFGYGNKKIGPNGDVGWVEYLLLQNDSKAILPGISGTLWCLVNEYVPAVKNMTCQVLDMIADELQIEPKDVLSKLIRDEKSDTCFRVNYYPPCPQLQALSGRDLIGFGAHTDPQILSVLRSSNTSGLQICLKDGSWVSVPPDHTSFYFNVGDSLQVMTNGRFRSVKHRVLANSLKARLSMIYFGGPPMNEKIVPLPTVMEEGEKSLYEEFTWSDYKKSAYGTRLGDNRLSLFLKSAANYRP
ncbi:gibberellin 2-beta-dioxygenase [Phtheirospermum japonicum]|uniref:gibberellin 2beta-dioxygenase n=1 Tax=Phtheirospermum japonicum TaxID=374723 RepID=A0A830CQ96_9LAMI|nr:gibberellin 2-beta-dioxygenase [Phtheirospermum japonicum]